MTDWLDSLAEGVSNRSFRRRRVLQAGSLTALGAALSNLFPGLASAATYPCACGNCQVATINERTRTVTLSACSGTCVAKSMCVKTVKTSSFTTLAAALASRGFVPSRKEAPQALRMVSGTTPFGTVLALPFQGSATPANNAQIMVFTPPSGPVLIYAVVYSGAKFRYLLQENAAGKIISRGAPEITLPTSSASLQMAETPALSQSDCTLYAILMCAVTVTILGRALQAGICAYVALQTGGLAAAACPWIFAVAATLLTTGTGFCGKYANLLCTTRFIYCKCNKTDYKNPTTCTSNCRATLGCFTGICGPQSAAKYVHTYNFL